jgi:hypothetical protein
VEISFRTAWLAGCFTAMVVVPGKPPPVADGAKVAAIAQAAIQQRVAVEASAAR